MATAPDDPMETQTGTLEKMLLSTCISQCESHKDEVKISNHTSIIYTCIISWKGKAIIIPLNLENI